MNIRELIKQLELCKPGEKVFFVDDEGHVYPVSSVSTEKPPYWFKDNEKPIVILKSTQQP